MVKIRVIIINPLMSDYIGNILLVRTLFFFLGGINTNILTRIFI